MKRSFEGSCERGAGLFCRILVIAVVTALVGSAGIFAQAPSPADAVEDLGRGILAALRSGSFEAMEHLLPTAEDLIEVIETQVKSAGGVSEEQLEEMKRQVPDIVAATRDHLATEFARLREPRREIDWSSIAMKGVRINVRDPETFEEREVDDATLAADQRPTADVQILFEVGGRTREIDLQDCFKSSRSWLVMEALSLRQ